MYAIQETGLSEKNHHLRDWNTIDTGEQTRIRIEYGHYLDSLPPTCSLDTKTERFRKWLREEKGIDYRG
jgi:hypothetical protein